MEEKKRNEERKRGVKKRVLVRKIKADEQG